MEDPLKRAIQLADILQPSIKVVSITMDRAPKHMISVMGYKTIARYGYVLLNGQIIYVQIEICISHSCVPSLVEMRASTWRC
jgi:hypothetical protein